VNPSKAYTIVKFMRSPLDIGRYSVRSYPEPNPTEPIPFGRGSAGLYTAHPVGLVVVVGVLLMGLFALPEARWFLGGAFLLGGIWDSSFGFVTDKAR
jgi:hypothetical protein